MDIDRAITLTQDRLAEEGGTMGELLGRFRNRISPVLIGDREWERILEFAANLPITMGALPFGFELPLHERSPEADFGASLASGTRAAAFFEERARADETDETAKAIVRLFERMETGVSPPARDRRPQADAGIRYRLGGGEGPPLPRLVPAAWRTSDRRRRRSGGTMSVRWSTRWFPASAGK